MLSSFSTLNSIAKFQNVSSAPAFTLNTTGGILRYNMDRSGTSVTDSFSTRNGNVVGTALWSTTVPTSFTSLATSSWGRMAGTNTNYIAVPSFPITSRNVSISFWTFCDGSSSLGDHKWFELDHSEGLMLFQNKNTSNYAYCYLATFSMSHNVWHHVVCIDDYTNLNKMVYVDGTLVTTVSFASNTNFFITNASTCNAGRMGAGLTAHNAPRGDMTDFRIYNRVLSASEITAIYNKTA